MLRKIPITQLLIPLVFAYVFAWLTFSNEKVFWYFYTFTTLFLMSLAYYSAKIEDELNTIHYLILSIAFGALTYALLFIGYKLVDFTSFTSTKSINSFIRKFGPSSIWHFFLLLFIIAPGEEIFWRGFIQQQLKKYLPPVFAIVVGAALFSFSFAFSGFWLGVLAAFIIGLVFGLLYEWKKSMPLIILAHIIMLILLFLVIPFT
ncbi:CPBP family intramembrane glutamic endopeptidase [Psychrobacillus soli]|uniref:CPBP family intramembrane metalloprotease n=1 Tax=Psychrobacillus soli TaxID=1543965 RepID=A0A544T2I0_9BACI|nr:type II CAAX endopeptidase family protein [Psychrobacillus soli]TQR11663.1 CPBP family intramembrane metalloprotease [Psychrobacillus soli]